MIPPEISKEEVAKLKRQFPTAMSFIQKPDFGLGWLDLFKDLCMRLETLSSSISDPDYQFYITSAKEKFGRMTVYIGSKDLPVSYYHGDAFEFIQDAGRKSLKICEYTGEPGSTYMLPSGWIKTMSKEKAEELLARPIDRERLLNPFKFINETPKSYFLDEINKELRGE
jgi:hypothetical protein